MVRFSDCLNFIRNNEQSINRYLAVGAVSSCLSLWGNLALYGPERHTQESLERERRNAYPVELVRIPDQNGDHIQDFVASDDFLHVPFVSENNKYVRGDLVSARRTVSK